MNKSAVAAISCAVLAVVYISSLREARAQSFSTVACAGCPTYTEVHWTFYSSELPKDPNCSAGTCPHYINNVNQWRSVLANKWVKQFQFRVDSFETELVYDYVDYGELFGTLSRLTGTPSLGWYGVTSSSSVQQKPIDILFHADQSVSRPGFKLGRARVCCNISAPILPVIPQRFVVPLERTTGVLLGDGDTVYTAISIEPGVGKQSLALWGSSLTDFDIYVRCNAVPTPTAWDFRGYSSNSQELLILPRPGGCTYPGTWYVAIHSYSGKGPFNLVSSPMFSSGVVSLRVGTAFDASTSEISTISNSLSLASRQFFGQTEGQILINRYDIWNNTGSACSNCGGQACDICFKDEPGTGDCCDGTQLTIKRDYFDKYEGIAHEYGHRFLGVPDEYTSETIDRCGHSNMASVQGSQNNFCVDMDHNTDRTPGAPPSSTPSVWSAAYGAGKLPRGMFDTGDNYDYVDHDFNDLISVAVH